MAIVLVSTAQVSSAGAAVLAAPGQGFKCHLTIARESLEDALVQLAKQCDLEVAGFSEIEPRRPLVGPLWGDYTRKQALSLLLRGTGLSYRFANERTVAIIRQIDAAPCATCTPPPHQRTSTPRSCKARRTINNNGNGHGGKKMTGESAAEKKHGIWYRIFRFFAGSKPDKTSTCRTAATAMLATACAVAACGVAHAQGTPRQHSEKSKASRAQLKQIIVTATRRATRLEDTPISMSVLSSNYIRANRIQNLTDVEGSVPSLEYVPQSGSETYLSMRGVTSLDDSSGTDQPIVMYVDDIPRTSVGDLQPELFDVQRIEVLNGPQGTLFGRNAVGGVIRIFTNPPTFANEGSLELGYGNYDRVELKAMINGPLIANRLAGRMTLTRTTRGNFDKDITTGQMLGAYERWTSSGKLLFTPSHDLRLLLGYQYEDYSVPKSPMHDIGNFQPSLDPNFTFNPLQTAQGKTGKIRQTNWQISAHLDWKLPFATLTSITGYRHVYAYNDNDLLADPRNTNRFLTISKDHQVTQEIHLASSAGRRFTWLVGVYYLNLYRSRPLDYILNVVPGSLLQSFGILPSPINFYNKQHTLTRSYAGFADVTYALAHTVKLDVGGRYSWEQKSGYSFANYSGIVSGGPISAIYSHSWSDFTPKATITYKPTSALMAYATISQGFLSGGYNVAAGTSAGLGTPFGPEYATNYEVGVKYTGLDHRFRADVSGYLVKYRDLQVVEFDSRYNDFITRNAGRAKSSGVEASFEFLPVDWLTLGVRYDHLDATYTNFVINNGPGVPPTVDTGNRQPFAPPNTVTASAEARAHLPNDAGMLAIGANYTYRDPYYLTSENNYLPGILAQTAWHGMVNAHLTWTSANARWEVQLWGRNLTDIVFLTNPGDDSIYIDSPAEANNPSLYIQDSHTPVLRTYGVSATLYF